MMKKVVCIVAVAMLVLVCSPLSLSVKVEAALEDPVNTAMAPHLKYAVYTLQEPLYSTPCDERGDFKVSVGSPTITADDSKLAISTDTALVTRVILSTVDAPEINATRTYFQFAFSLNKVSTGYTNISLFDTSHTDWINVSITGSQFIYDYSTATKVTGTLYGTAVANTDYIIGIDLTASSVTIYLYSASQVLLANKYITGQDLVGGDLREMRFEHSGSAYKTLYLDYLYVLGSPELRSSSMSSAKMDVIKTNQKKDQAQVDIDPTNLNQDTSLKTDLLGVRLPTSLDDPTVADVLNALPFVPQRETRTNSRMIAEGWTSAGDSVELVLKEYIADLEAVESSKDVYLIDYYVDYVQFRSTYSSTVVQKMVERFNDLFERVALAVDKRMGGTPASSSHASIASFDPGALYASSFTLVPNLTNPAVQKGLQDPTKWWITSSIFTDLFVKMGWLIDVEDEVDKFFNNLGNGINDIKDAFEENITNGIAEFDKATKEWQASVEESYKSVISDMTHALMVSQSTIAQLTADYSDAIQNAQRQMSEFYAYTERQWQQTSAVISQLLLRNADLEESMLNMQQYFAGQSAKTNDVIMNLTSQLADTLGSNQFWKNVLQDGKVADKPLTFSTFFGNDMPKIWMYVFIAIGVLLVAIIIIAVLKTRKNRAGGHQQS